MIKAICFIIIIYTNHSTTIFLIKQFNFNITIVKKFNLRFVRIFKYLQRFRFDVCYKFDKINVVFDVFFRLINREFHFEFDKFVFDVLQISFTTFIYAKILIEMTNQFKQRFKNEYITNQR